MLQSSGSLLGLVKVGGWMGRGPLYEVQQGEMPVPTCGSQFHATLQAWGIVAGKLPNGKGPWGCWSTAAEDEPAHAQVAKKAQSWLPGLCGQERTRK